MIFKSFDRITIKFDAILQKAKTHATAMCATRANLAGKYLRLTLKQNNLERKVLNARAKKINAGGSKDLRCEIHD